MGQIAVKLTKPLRNYNVDNRAAKILARRQKVAEPAPYYPSTVEKLSRFRDEHPELLEAQKTKDEKLHGYLKEVYVKSTDNFEQSNTSTKSLPLNRIPPPEPDMGSLEHISGKISEGRVTLKTVFSFLGQHRSDPQNFSIQKIAKDNKLDEKDVENVLNFFKILHLYIPKEMYDKNKKMKKYVAEQFKLSSSAASPPFVLSDKTQKKDDKEKPQDLSPTKT